MKLIPTTATAVEKLKARAKAVKQIQNIPHSAALELAAKEAGYDDWHHVQQCFAQTGATAKQAGAEDDQIRRNEVIAEHQAYMDYLARKALTSSVTTKPIRGNFFHDVEIEGIRFKGLLTMDGLGVGKYLGSFEEGWVQLGVAEIHFTEGRDIRSEPGEKKWWACKYGPNETRIDLSNLSPAGRHTFAHEFGLPVYYYSGGETPNDAMMMSGAPGGMFYLSPAFRGLCAWAKAHPRKIRAIKARGFLGDWVTAAIEATNPFEKPDISDDELWDALTGNTPNRHLSATI